MKRRNDSGQSIVEVAICISAFLMLVMAAMDFGYLFNVKTTLQNAVRQGGRYAITGQCMAGSGPGGSCDRYDSIIDNVESLSLGLATANNITISCTPNGGGCPNAAGGPGDIVKIQVVYPYHFMTGPIAAFFSGGVYNITVSATFTNQPFPPSES